LVGYHGNQFYCTLHAVWAAVIYCGCHDNHFCCYWVFQHLSIDHHHHGYWVYSVRVKVPIHVRVWLASLPQGAWIRSQVWMYFIIHTWVDSGSWHSTHGQFWLIGTRAQPDSLARLVRVWAPLDIETEETH
jgi:hypothetical protein